MPIDFLYVVDDVFSDFLSLGLRAIRHFHPAAGIHIYDLTSSPSARIASLAKTFNAEVIHWPGERWINVNKSEEVDFDYFHPQWQLNDELKYQLRKFRSHLGMSSKPEWMINKQEWLKATRRKMNIWAQKAACAADCIGKTKSNFVFLDADAFVWQGLDEVFEGEFDVGLTLRRLSDIKIGLDPGIRAKVSTPYNAINAGVIFFRNNTATQEFIKRWLQQIQVCDHYMIEQTALSELCIEADRSMFGSYYREAPLVLDGASPVLKIFPCERYNNTYMGSHLDIDSDTVIAHFKGSLHQEKYMEKIEEILIRRLNMA